MGKKKSIIMMAIGFVWLTIGWKLTQMVFPQLFWFLIGTDVYGGSADWALFGNTLAACVISTDFIAFALILIGWDMYRLQKV